jgi:ATP-dependent DNA ligase
MNLPVNPPILPMLAKRVDAIPKGDDWIFEPKWDGFRVVVFRDGDEVLLQSREKRPLNRYFPDVLDPLRQQLPARCVLDGEIVIARQGRLDFDALQLRIHPAASRVQLLARETPASLVFFDLLCEGKKDLRGDPFELRRARLEELLHSATPPVFLTPATRDRAVAQDWFRRFEGAGLDGVVAKAIKDAYQPDKRVMLKVKHERDCDCVVAGFRWYKEAEGREVGSLLLGLYDNAGTLQHVGVCASFSASQRRELFEFLAPYRKNALKDHPWRDWANSGEANRMPGAVSRVMARIYPGNPSAPSSLSKLLTSTCSRGAFATLLTSIDGGPTGAPAAAPSPNWKWFRLRNSRKSFTRGVPACEPNSAIAS